MNKLRALEAVQFRIEELQKDNEFLEQIETDQEGTSIPNVTLTTQKNFIIDPSNVGTGILDRMIKTDDTINSAVQFKIMMILSKMGEYDHENTEIKEFVKGFLEDMRYPAWGSAMESMLSYHGYKFSVSEIVYGMKDNLNKFPIKIATYHPSTIAFEVDETGDITENGIIQFAQQRSLYNNFNWRFQSARHGFKTNNPFSTPIDRLHPFRVPNINDFGVVRIPRSKVIHIAGQEWHSFGNPYGNAGTRTAHLLWQLKVFLMKQMGIAAKRKASPKLWGTAPKGTQQVEVSLPNGEKQTVSARKALELMLKDLQDFDSVVTGSQTEGYNITTLDDRADLNQFVSVINNINTWMFRCYLLPSLVMTDGQAGSRSLGDKHFEIVDKIAESEANKFGKHLINQMIERVIIDNFGQQNNYGTFLRRPQTVEERQRLASMFGQLANDGWMSPATRQDMDYVRDSLKLTPTEDTGFEKENDDIFQDVGFIPGVDDKKDEGAKVDLILRVVEKVVEGILTSESAIALLVSSGVEEETAIKIIDGLNIDKSDESSMQDLAKSAVGEDKADWFKETVLDG